MRVIPLAATDLCADGLMTVLEAARFLGVSRGALYNLMDRGALPYSRVGFRNLRRIPRRALVEIAAENMVHVP